MAKIYYWHGAVGSPELIDEHKQTVKNLIQGDYNASDLEELRGYNIYSYRTSLAGRLLFTSIMVAGVSHLLLLEYLPTHDYHKSRFLQSGVLKQYIKKNEDVIRIAVLDDIAASVEQPVFIRASKKPDFLVQTEDACEEMVALEYFKDKFIQLSQQQNLAMGVKELSAAPLPQLPLIASGAAGSGKSLLALLLLSTYVNNRVHQADHAELEIHPILYVCESITLAKKMRSIWMQLPVSQGIPADLVHFKTYNELLKANHAESTIVSKQHFDRWFKGYFDQYSLQRKASMKKVKALSEHELDKDDPLFLAPEKVYQEFRICSAYNEHDYLVLGKRQCEFSSAEQKTWVYRAYLNYKAYLTGSMSIDPGFSELELTRWGLVVVDEAQDLTPKQLEELLAIAIDHSIAYFLDNHQSLRDSNSKKAFLLKLLQEETKRCVRHLELSQTHRCLPNIAEAANEIVALKYALTGGKSDKDEISRIESVLVDGNAGRVFVVESSSLMSSAWVKEQQGSDFAVVTLPEFFDEARSLFKNTPLVLTVEQIKGLEYNTIIAYKIFSEGLFKKIHQTLPGDVPDALSQHRAKAGVGDHAFGPHLNQIYTCFTRAINTLVICQKQTRENKLLFSRLLRITSPFDMSVIQEKTISSADEWKAEVIKQIQVGNLIQAKDIFLKKVINNEVVYNFFEEEQQQKLLAHSEAVSKSSDSLMPVHPAPLVVISPHQGQRITLATLLADFTEQKLLGYLKSEECDLNATIHVGYPKPSSASKKGKKIHQVQKQQNLLEYIFSSANRMACFTGCLKKDEAMAQRLVGRFFEPIESLFKSVKMDPMTQDVLIKALLVFDQQKAMQGKAVFHVVVRLLTTPITNPNESFLYWVTEKLDYVDFLLKMNVLQIPSASWGVGPLRKSPGVFVQTPIDNLLKSQQGIILLQGLMRRDPGYLATTPIDIWRQFPAVLSKLISSLVPQNLTAKKLKINTQMVRLTFVLDPLEAESNNILSVQLIGNVGNQLDKSTTYPPLLDHRFIIYMKSGEKEVLQFNSSPFVDPASNASGVFFEILCENNFALPEMAFCEYGVKPPHAVHAAPSKTLQNQIDSLLDAIILHELHRLIISDRYISRVVVGRGIQLIHLNPIHSLVLVARKSFASFQYKGHINFDAIVVDSSQERIERMKVVDKTSNFVCLDLKQIEHLPARFAFDENKIKCVIVNGALSRHHIQGAYDVAKILQKLCVHAEADIIIITGSQAPVLTPKIGEAIGCSTVLKNVRHSADHKAGFNDYSSLLILINKCRKEKMEHVSNVSKGRARKASHALTVLDISLSATPFEMCQLFSSDEYQAEITQVDLSWSYVQLEQIPGLIQVLKKFQKLKYILLSTHEPWADEFIAQMKVVNKYFIVRRNDCADPDELPAISIEEARILGIYDALPSIELFKPTAAVALLEAPARAAPLDSFFGRANTSEIPRQYKTSTHEAKPSTAFSRFNAN